VKPLLKAIAAAWERMPRWFVVVVSLLIIGVNFLASSAAVEDLRFSFFYTIPVALTAWFVGRRTGVFFSFLGAGSWLAEKLLESPEVAVRMEGSVILWNTALLLGFFLLLSSVMSALRASLLREKAAARLDPLTQIPNRRFFFELASAEIQRMARYGGTFTVAYLDLDNFKEVNDVDGHEIGDRVLVLVARVLRRSLRVNDVVARLGGDEFVVLLPETGAREADAAFRKIERELATAMSEGGWSVTVSIGVATYEKPPASVEQMVRLVDELMYSAKARGKNCLEKRIIRA
jgi:diguanylate cyclase (GGDEF)-like protein